MGARPTRDKLRGALLRGVAMLLVAALLSAALLYRRADVALSAEGLENKGARVAAMQLLALDDYAKAPRLSRMSDFARSLVRGEHILADYELAAQIAIAQRRYVDASAFTDRSIELYDGEREGMAALYLRQGYLYTLQEKYPEALAMLDRGLAIAPSPEALLTRAQVKLNLGDTSGALEDVTGYLQTADDAAPLLPELVNVYEAADEFEAAAGLYTRLIDATGDGEYLLNRAYCYTSLDRMEEAAADCERYAAAGGAEVAAAYVMIGIGWMRGGAYDKADDCFVRAIDERYSDPQSLYYYVVLCAYVTGNYARACEYGDKLMARALGGESADVASVQLENTTGRLNVALAEMDLGSLCLMTGASHMCLGEYEKAIQCLTACLEQDSGASYANYLRGSCLLAAERYAEAVPDFDAAIAAGEEVEKSRYGRAVCRMQLGDVEGAMEDFDWVVLSGEDPELFEEASALLAKLINENPSGDAEEAPAAAETAGRD